MDNDSNIGTNKTTKEIIIKQFPVTGMSCASCAAKWRTEEDQLKGASILYSLERLSEHPLADAIG